MTDDVLSLAEELAFQLSHSAIQLDQARQEPANKALLATALEQNMETWIGLKTIVSADGCTLPDAVKVNLCQLAEFVTSRTLQGVEAVTASTVDALINVNLQISEGLLEGQAKG